jgi:flagellar motor switch protein FliN/FliY
MSELNPELASSLLEMCRSGAGDTAEALSRALDGTFTAEIGAAATFAEIGEAELDGPGLAVLFNVGAAAIVGVLPEASGLLPAWYQKPDATGTSKLATLAQELGMIVLPEALPVGETKTHYIANLKDALAAAGVSGDATQVALKLAAGEKSGVMRLIWPLTTPAALIALPVPAAAPAAAAPSPEPKPTPKPAAPAKPAVAPVVRSAQPPDFSGLPGYSRSLLKIDVPVSVELASKKETLHEVISLAPGSIIKFDKGCEQLLRLVVGKNAVAEGEAVKVGEKFGFRVTAMLLPPEHFVTAKRRSA